MELNELERKLGRLAYRLAQVEETLRNAQAMRQGLQQEATAIANQIADLENKPPGGKDADNS